MGGLVAQVEGELFLVGDLAGGGVVAGGFEVERAPAEPMMLGHSFDERGLVPAIVQDPDEYRIELIQYN